MYVRCSTVSGLPISRRGKSMPRCWTKENICAPGGQCTVFWMKIRKCGNAATSCATRVTPNRSCWLPNRTSYGAGIIHQAPWTNKVDLLLSLQYPGCLQPLLGRLDDRRTRIRQPGRRADRRHLCSPEYSTGTTHHPCRPRQLDDLQTGGLAHGGSGCDQNPLAPHVSNDNPFSESHMLCRRP